MEEKVIVSLTSWTKRIHFTHHTIYSILEGSVKPDKIVLNLSKEEFEGIPLPDEISELSLNGDIEIFWVDGPNTKAFKKLLPTVDRYPNDIIVTVDDDIYYPYQFLEFLLEDYRKDPSRPVTVAYNRIDDMLLPWGGGVLYKASMLADYRDFLTDKILATQEDDWFYAFYLLTKGIRIKMSRSEIVYDPMIYIQTTFACQMYDMKTYNSDTTFDVLRQRLDDLGYDYTKLNDNLYAKYKYSF